MKPNLRPRDITTPPRITIRYPIFGVLAAVGGVLICCAFSALPPSPDARSPQSSLEARIRANPDKFAWEVFIVLSTPQSEPGNNNVVWENWADSALVYGDPNHAPRWPSQGNAPGKFDLKINQELGMPGNPEGALVTSQKKIGETPPPPPREDGKMEEIRMNQATFDFIVAKNLWYVEGQEEASAVGKDLSFPTAAREVKAVWKEITPVDRPRYHWQITHGKLYGLVALHITTRDLPNWVWASFEHVDNERKDLDLASRDNFGLTGTNLSPELLAMFKAADLAAEWQNYRLTGCQIEFLDKAGLPTLVGNSEIEGNRFPQKNVMKSSSCITCHSRSTIDGQGRFLPVYKSLKPREGYVGIPDPAWVIDESGNRLYMKRDFVWSLFEARCRCVQQLPGQVLSFAKDILPKFRQEDIQCMAEHDVFLGEYSWMADPDHAETVYGRLTATTGSVMPPSGKWPSKWIDEFKAWKDGGMKP